MAITIPADIWLEVLTYLEAKDVKNLIYLSNLAFSRLIVYHAKKKGFMKKMQRIEYRKTLAKIADLNKVNIGYEICGSKETTEIPPFGSRIVNTGIRFSVPDGIKARIFNAPNVNWTLMTEETLSAGKHGSLVVKMQNIHSQSIPLPSNEAIATVFFQEVNQQTSDCYLAPTTNVTIPSKRVCPVPVQQFLQFPPTQPSSSQGCVAMIVGDSKFRMGQEVFVVPRLASYPLPERLTVDVANSTADDVVVQSGQPLALFSAFPYQDYFAYSI